MLRAAINDPDPVVVIEARSLYQTVGTVDLIEDVPPVGGAAFRRRGSDLAIISWGTSCEKAQAAADQLADDGVSATVLDLRWLAPLDEEAIVEAVSSSGGRAIVVHEANLTGGFGAEVTARIHARLFSQLNAPVTRIATPDTRIPSAPALQDALMPQATDIVQAALAMCTP